MASNKFDVLSREDSNDSSSKSDESEETGENGEFIFPDEPVVEKGEHRLQYCYCLWFSRKNPGKQQVTMKYEDSIKLIGAFSSAEQFWAYYSYMVRPGELTGHSDIHLFKHGIRPMWEDKANKNGGKWIVRLKKGLASRCWENLILAMLGEQFMVGPEVCGAVVSLRYQEDIISIWNRNASDQATTSRIRDTLRRVLNLPQNTIMEYKAHMASLTDHSSYRNTNVFVR
ncbi:eukaryotic translation initiation factor 4E type 2-like isoform X2 [Hydractinia symbiolongicarpus]|uniref:eukaryotic translation initiation factor 4E type 2-like isoform X2 n=1 Tax=Hydractinia symbiolongicarpus TaxID=13093 RepID=UPI00254E46BC|nr:eukaryotic translation initiation factor 4E type 2-like isoform X2 [Hydractinia symbiolongicarpus]